jgi:hypothetical protein
LLVRALAAFGRFLGFLQLAFVFTFCSFTHALHSLFLLGSFVDHRWLRRGLRCSVSASLGHADTSPLVLAASTVATAAGSVAASLFLEARGAVDGFVAAGLKRHWRFLAAGRADHTEHLARSTAVSM